MFLQLLFTVTSLWFIGLILSAILCPIITGERLERRIFWEAMGIVYLLVIGAAITAHFITILIL